MRISGRIGAASLGAAALFLLGTGLMTQAQGVVGSSMQEQQAKSLLAKDRSAYQQVASGLTGKQARLDQLASELANAQDQASASAAAEARDQARLKVTEGLLQATEARVTAAKARLRATEALYRATAAKLAITERRLIHERALFAGQLRLVEEHGSIGYLSVMVGSHSFADFVSRVAMLGQIAAQAAIEVHAIHTEVVAVAAQKAAAGREKAALAETASTLAAQESSLNQTRMLVAAEAAQAAQAHSQAEVQAQTVSYSVQQVQQQMAELRAEQDALKAQMASLSSEISRIASRVGTLIRSFSNGNLSREQLYRAMLPVVEPIAQRFGLSPALIIAVITEESGGNQSAVSSTGAIGLMQLEPGTAASLGIDPYNTEQNVLGGSLYLSQMLQMFGGNLSLALAAYNAGPGAVEQNGNQVPSYCQQYVGNIEALYQLYQSYGP